MNIVPGTITLIAGIVGIVLIILTARKNTYINTLKKEEGKIITGIKKDCTVLYTYRPTAYAIWAEYEINNERHRQEFLTFDNRIKKVPINGQLKIIYVDKINKIYWADDKSMISEMSFHIMILSIVTGLMLMASVVYFVKGM